MSKPPSRKPSVTGAPNQQKKPYELITASFNGNEVKIKVPKSLSKPPLLTPSQLKLQQQCTCDDDESVCSDFCSKGAAGRNNKLILQVPDDICESLTNRTPMNSEMVYSKQLHHETLCDSCGQGKDAKQGLQVKQGQLKDKDIYLLKLGKQSDEPARIGNIEVELITPKAPAKRIPPPHSCQEVQCEENELPCCAPCKSCRPAKKKKPKRVICCP